MKHLQRFVFAIILVATLSAHRSNAAPTTQPRSVRVAAVGALNDDGFWTALVQRFEQTTGIHVDPASTGNKDGMGELFRQGKCDVIVTAPGDGLMNLVADGYAMDAVPWMKSDVVLVGPSNDPAGIKGTTDIAEAIKKIAETKSTFVNHSSSGADETLRNILIQNHIELDLDHTISLVDDHQRRVFQYAVDKHAYTFIARLPFKSNKLLHGDLALMVENDPRFRRPFMVAVANPIKVKDANLPEARMFAAFLRSDATQAWIAGFGKGKYDDRSIYFPIVTRAEPSTAPSTQPSRGLLSVVGDVPHPLFLDSAAWSQLPRHEVQAKMKDGSTAVYQGVLVRDVLKLAGIPLGDHHMNRANVGLSARIEAADAYSAVFAIPEFDDDYAERSILLADQRDGKPLDASQGPLRLIAPQENQPARWVRQVQSISVQRAQ